MHRLCRKTGLLEVLPSGKFEAAADVADGHDVDSIVRAATRCSQFELRRLAIPQRTLLG